jgi:protein-tyrosine phosphatase
LSSARGKSRSASVVVGYFMFKHNMSYAEAYAQVKAKRQISINAGFEEQLRKFDFSSLKCENTNL